jgi:hypothetical protein
MNTAEMLMMFQLQSMSQAWKSDSKSANGKTDDSQALLFAALLQSALAGEGGLDSSNGLLLEVMASQMASAGTYNQVGLGLNSISPEFASYLGGSIQGNSYLGNSAIDPLEVMGAYNSSYNNVAKPEIEKLISETAQRHGVDPNLVRQVVQAESNFNPKAVSSAGAMGLMQLMPATAQTYGVTDPFNPAQNLDGGVRFLKGLLERFDGNTALALAGYNAGPGAVEKYNGIPPYRETQNYVQKILKGIGQFNAQA